MNTFSPKNKKKGCEWIAIFCDFCNFFADSFVYSFIFYISKTTTQSSQPIPRKMPLSLSVPRTLQTRLQRKCTVIFPLQNSSSIKLIFFGRDYFNLYLIIIGLSSSLISLLIFSNFRIYLSFLFLYFSISGTSILNVLASITS